MLMNTKVTEILDKSAKSSDVYGIPFIFLNLMETEEFKNAYKDYDINDLSNQVKEYSDIYSLMYLEKQDNMGADAYSLRKKILSTIAEKYSKVFDASEITLVHLFLACCTICDSIDLEKYFEDNSIKKEEIAKNIYQEETGNTVKLEDIPNLFVELDMTNLKMRVEKKGIKVSSGAVKSGKKGKFKNLEQFCTNLTEKAKSYTKPFVGREDVIERTLQVLCKKEKSNPVHIGEPGVGKSAVTKGLARLIFEKKVPDALKNATLYELDLTGLLAGTCYRGDFEKRIHGVLDELAQIENPILFIDEIHMILRAGDAEGGTSAANILKPYLTEGKIKFIGATTYNEYRKYIERDPALQRRFQKIEIVEPSIENAIGILNGVKKYYEDYHHITFTDDAIRSAVELTNKFIHDRFLPDKAIDMLDEAGAFNTISDTKKTVLDKEDIETIVAKTCRIPETTIKRDEIEKVSELDKDLKKNIFGQNEAIDIVTEKIMLSKSGLNDDEKPIGAFLFVGPSGVGKTELTKQIAKSLDMELLRFDMSEYQDSFNVSKLIGSPAGYVGYEEGGLLTEKILRNPHSVILFDEIEKAHPSIFKVFLQMLDYGMLTDNKGTKVDCRNTIIVMTSNAGVREATKSKIGFGTSSVNVDAIDDQVNEIFPVEFRNRLTAIIKFNPISDEMAKLVAKREIGFLIEKLKKQDVNLTVTEKAIDKIAKDGVSYEYGARNIQRLIDKEIKSLFVKAMINRTLNKNSTLDVSENHFVIS